MAEEHHNKPSYEYETAVGDDCKGGEEIKDRGLFDFLGKKKEEKPQEEVIVSEFEKVSVSEYEAPPKVEEYKEEKEEKEHATLFEKLHRSNSSSSSSSDEEEGEGEEKKKKKKKEKEDKLKEKEEEKKYEDTNVPIEKYEDAEVAHDIHAGPAQAEEKKGFLDKIKEKLPGQHKAEEVPPPPPPTEYAATEPPYEGEPKEKKGFLEKIKEKIPGYHPKTEEEKEKEKEKDIASH